ncbi:MAG: two-component regulator propeller domain-containing protein, partial [Flavobacterium sp.]
MGWSQEYAVKFLDTPNGLSHTSIRSIFQDSDGYMWFGTYDGLNRYDGYNFKVYRNSVKDAKSLRFNNIYYIEGDSKKNIWVGGSNGVCVYNKSNATFYPVQYHFANSKPKVLKDIIRQIKSVYKEQVLVGTQNLGLLLFENGSFTGRNIPLEGLNNKDIKYKYDAMVLEEDKGKGYCWVYVRNVGICKYDYHSKKLKVLFSLSMDVESMQVSLDHNLWLGTDEGLYLLNTKSGLLSHNYFSEKCTVTDILLDKKKELWLATDGCGIYKVVGESKKAVAYNSVRDHQLLKSNSIECLYEDTAGNKWIGTLRGGISMLSGTPKYFKSIRYNAVGNDPTENFILSFCEDEKNNIWIGTDGAGLKYWDRKNNSYVKYPNKLSSGFITSIIRDNNNDIWLSTWAGGINRINSDRTVSHFSCYNPYTKHIEKNIWLVYKDSKGNIWASATNEGFLYLFDRSKNNFLLYDRGIDNLQCLTETSDGKLWGGNYTSLVVIDKEKRKHSRISVSNPVRCILEDKSKNLWIGTQEGGLLLFDRKA